MASTLEGVIVKFADRIAYINHDIDDAVHACVLKETDIPEDIKIEKNKKSIYAFECSFDFYDVSIGIVLDTKELKVLSPIWATEQIPNAEQPDRVWIDFFLKTLAENISDDGSFGVPIYTFLNDSSDFTVTPTR